jgi:hypothetical protein
MDNFVLEIMTKKNKVIEYSGYDIKIQHHKGNVFISFINTSGKECIGVDYYKNGELHLGNYYFNTPSNCLRIPNDWFFNEFLKPLGKKLKVKSITLNDASSKQFTLCAVPMIFFALAGKQTFYNRYGFVNKRFDRYIEKLKTRTLHDIEITNSLVLSKGKTLPIALMKRLIKSGYLDKPIPEVAQFVLDKCKESESDISESDISIVKDIIKFFKMKIIIENNFELIMLKSKSK